MRRKYPQASPFSWGKLQIVGATPHNEYYIIEGDAARASYAAP